MVNSYSVTEKRSPAVLRLEQADCVYLNGDSKLLRDADSSVPVGAVTSGYPDPVLIVYKVL
jgi:hypothetical protein